MSAMVSTVLPATGFNIRITAEMYVSSWSRTLVGAVIPHNRQLVSEGCVGDGMGQQKCT